MSNDQNLPPPSQRRHRQWENALQLGSRKKRCLPDPLVHYGRHFCRTAHALCSVHALIQNGIRRMDELASESDDSFTTEELREHRVFLTLLRMVSGLEDRLRAGSPEEIRLVADLIQKGSSGARSDDTRSLKGAIIDWISPGGQSLDPPLSRNVKMDRGFHHERTGFLLCPADLDWSDAETKERLRNGDILISGDHWPVFLYHQYSFDPEDPWKGLFRSALIVAAYKHVFISPSSVNKESRATRSGNARIHDMTCVTPASIAYIATQVRFGLSSSPVFSRTGTTSDCEQFYTSVLDLLEDPDETEEVQDLVRWWNHQIFLYGQRRPATNSVLAKIKDKRATVKAANIVNTVLCA